MWRTRECWGWGEFFSSSSSSSSPTWHTGLVRASRSGRQHWLPKGSAAVCAPQGVESAVRLAMVATMKQVATLRNSAHGWKVVAFENSFEKMDALTVR
jgi:hypothetical protein